MQLLRRYQDSQVKNIIILSASKYNLLSILTALSTTAGDTIQPGSYTGVKLITVTVDCLNYIKASGDSWNWRSVKRVHTAYAYQSVRPGLKLRLERSCDRR